MFYSTRALKTDILIRKRRNVVFNPEQFRLLCNERRGVTERQRAAIKTTATIYIVFIKILFDFDRWKINKYFAVRFGILRVPK